jgi:hypothetical protein
MENNQKEIILLKDLGMQFPKDTSNEKKRYGLYRCHCGNEFRTITSSIKNGDSKSCGCLKGNRSHNLKNHRLYSIWNQMIQRCNNQKHKYYNDYGARGITVCDEWLDINNFINDMFPSYQEGLSIDRIDNNKGYSKDNCRWTTKSIQARNTRVLQKNNTTGYRGVVYYGNKFKTIIGINSQSIKIGIFNTSLEAAKAYDNYVILHNLEHTRNFS